MIHSVMIKLTKLFPKLTVLPNIHFNFFRIASRNFKVVPTFYFCHCAVNMLIINRVFKGRITMKMKNPPDRGLDGLLGVSFLREFVLRYDGNLRQVELIKFAPSN